MCPKDVSMTAKLAKLYYMITAKDYAQVQSTKKNTHTLAERCKEIFNMDPKRVKKKMKCATLLVVQTLFLKLLNVFFFSF